MNNNDPPWYDEYIAWVTRGRADLTAEDCGIESAEALRARANRHDAELEERGRRFKEEQLRYRYLFIQHEIGDGLFSMWMEQEHPGDLRKFGLDAIPDAEEAARLDAILGVLGIEQPRFFSALSSLLLDSEKTNCVVMVLDVLARWRSSPNQSVEEMLREHVIVRCLGWSFPTDGTIPNVAFLYELIGADRSLSPETVGDPRIVPALDSARDWDERLLACRSALGCSSWLDVPVMQDFIAGIAESECRSEEDIETAIQYLREPSLPELCELLARSESDLWAEGAGNILMPWKYEQAGRYVHAVDFCWDKDLYRAWGSISRLRDQVCWYLSLM